MNGSSYEVNLCLDTDCALYGYRFGIKPETAERHGKEVGATRGSAFKAANRYCRNCYEGNVSECPIPDCVLYRFRFGVRPDTAERQGKKIARDLGEPALEGNFPRQD